jgi:hypothetical protein
MPGFDPLSQEVVYLTKGNVKAPAGSSAAAGVALAASRINDYLAKPLKLSGETDTTVTANANAYPVADTATPVS